VLLRKTAICGTILGVLFAATYWASPFRVQTRDWQIVCRGAGNSLLRHKVSTVVSIGSGPFPERGVGWEAGYTSSFFGRAKLVATAEQLPTDLSSLQQDIQRASADAVLMWSSDLSARIRTEQALIAQYPVAEAIVDPQLGEVGTILYENNR
jgi:hypothetical protein